MQSEVTLSIGGLIKKNLVLVAKALTHECLLGADFLMQHGYVVDLEKINLYAGGKAVSFFSYFSGSSVPIASCHVTIFSYTTVVPE